LESYGHASKIALLNLINSNKTVVSESELMSNPSISCGNEFQLRDDLLFRLGLGEEEIRIECYLVAIKLIPWRLWKAFQLLEWQFPGNSYPL